MPPIRSDYPIWPVQSGLVAQLPVAALGGPYGPLLPLQRRRGRSDPATTTPYAEEADDDHRPDAHRARTARGPRREPAQAARGAGRVRRGPGPVPGHRLGPGGVGRGPRDT